MISQNRLSVRRSRRLLPITDFLWLLSRSNHKLPLLVARVLVLVLMFCQCWNIHLLQVGVSLDAQNRPSSAVHPADPRVPLREEASFMYTPASPSYRFVLATSSEDERHNRRTKRALADSKLRLLEGGGEGGGGYAAALLFHLAALFERELLRAEESAEADVLLSMFQKMGVEGSRAAADAKGKAPMHAPAPPAPPRSGDGEAPAPALALPGANDALLEQLTQSQFGKIALAQLYRVR
eukprot:1182467-Prorocentrum_minimum.AAC.2